MDSKVFLVSALVLAAVSAHAEPRGRAVPVISCNSAHISIVIYKATCHVAPKEDAPTCQASVVVDQGLRIPVSVTVNQGAIRPFNIPTLLFHTSEQSGSAVTDFRGMDKGGSGTYMGVGSVKLPNGTNTAEDMTCAEPQHQQGHL